MGFTVYLSGETHTDWRDQIRSGAEQCGLDITFLSAVTDHASSDAAGYCAALGKPYITLHGSEIIYSLKEFRGQFRPPPYSDLRKKCSISGGKYCLHTVSYVLI